MAQIDMNIIEPVPYITIMEGVGPKGDKGDKGDTGEVTQAEFDELSERVDDIRDDLTVAMEGLFELEDFEVSVDKTNFSSNLLVQNGSSYGTIYLQYKYTFPPSSLDYTASLSWTVNGKIYNETADVTDKATDIYTYGIVGTEGRKATEPVVNGDSTFNIIVKKNQDTAITKSAKLEFCDKIHYGVATSGTLSDSFVLNTLTGHTLTDTKELTISVNAGTNEYIFIAIPVAYGTPKFTVGGFEGGFTSLGVFVHTNEMMYKSTYAVYKSANKNLGSVKVDIS